MREESQQQDHFVSIKKWRISVHEEGMSLLVFLRKKNTDAYSMKSLKRAIDSKCCSVNGKTEIFSSHSLKENDLITFDDVRCNRDFAPVLKILYEDDDLLIVDKPAGLVCENRYFTSLLKKRAELIHRLDKETSGIVMLAKNPEIMALMISLFRKFSVHKQYLALIDGCIASSEGKIESKILKKKSSIPGQALFGTSQKRGLNAITFWKCLKKSQIATLVLCKPITGRTHQLRVHLSSIGHPILGDIRYAKRFRYPLIPHRHLLHARVVSFIHPKTRCEIRVKSPIPYDFKDALVKLKWDT